VVLYVFPRGGQKLFKYWVLNIGLLFIYLYCFNKRVDLSVSCTIIWDSSFCTIVFNCICSSIGQALQKSNLIDRIVGGEASLSHASTLFWETNVDNSACFFFSDIQWHVRGRISHNVELCVLYGHTSYVRIVILWGYDGLDMWEGWRRQGMHAEFCWGNLSWKWVELIRFVFGAEASSSASTVLAVIWRGISII
jgi:hypothetical protein